MNSNYTSPHYHAHKKRLQSDDLEISSFGLPRKKFISEESFAKEMAAMTLDPNLQLQQQQQQQQYYQFYNNRFGSHSSPSTSMPQNKNVVRIDHLSDDDDDEDSVEMKPGNMVFIDINGKKAIVDETLNGLPLELRPGEHKPRIPDFVLENSGLTDPRDKLAYQHMLNSLKGKNRHIEVLNDPSIHVTPTSMDID
ncbi:coq1 putative hexaprenyl diphosphate synthase [Mucor velutinosus]|uniref:Coq1 putative hexaprenyl diphosphate synthase n=1 Tax=Mucor velutinosus TaxID=708070 RepID=A0AAN7HSZ7_9FUNG|nr:coq1 putative hexaprenyl diphosphate synthase [Mucor velutinosus]